MPVYLIYKRLLEAKKGINSLKSTPSRMLSPPPSTTGSSMWATVDHTHRERHILIYKKDEKIRNATTRSEWSPSTV
jgi:hypothetical protein